MFDAARIRTVFNHCEDRTHRYTVGDLSMVSINFGGVLGNRILHSRIASATRRPWNMAPRYLFAVAAFP